MNPLMEMVDQNGRLNYNNLVRFVRQTGLEFFVGYTNRPFLVGKELYEGLFTKVQFQYKATKTVLISKTNLNDTICFQRELTPTTTTGEENNPNASIARAIFMPVKKQYSKGMRNVISVGRSAENDMVIADYSISKHHAEIVIYFDKFFISDLGTTNGTSLNGVYLEPHKKYDLTPGGVMAMGRLAFQIMSAEELFNMLR